MCSGTSTLKISEGKRREGRGNCPFCGESVASVEGKGTSGREAEFFLSRGKVPARRKLEHVTLSTSKAEAKSTLVEGKYFASPQRAVFPSLVPFDIRAFYGGKG